MEFEFLSSIKPSFRKILRKNPGIYEYENDKYIIDRIKIRNVERITYAKIQQNSIELKWKLVLN